MHENKVIKQSLNVSDIWQTIGRHLADNWQTIGDSRHDSGAQLFQKEEVVYRRQWRFGRRIPLASRGIALINANSSSTMYLALVLLRETLRPASILYAHGKRH